MNFKKGDQLRYHQDLKTTTFLVRNQIWNNHATHYLYVWISGFKVWVFLFGGGSFCFVLFFNSEERITLETSRSQTVMPFPLPQCLLLYFLLYYILFLSRHKRRERQDHVPNKIIYRSPPHRVSVKWSFKKKLLFAQVLDLRALKKSNMKEVNVAS